MTQKENLVDIPVHSVVPSSGEIKLAIVGEAPAEEEVLKGMPFVGPSGRELNNWLHSAGIDRNQCYVGNVFSCKAPQNDVKYFLLGKREVDGRAGWVPRFPEGPGGWCPPELEHEIDRLGAEIRSANPNLILALGNTALWALTGNTGIMSYRGSLLPAAKWIGDYKVLPAYHPAHVLRNYSMRASAIMDIQKAASEMLYPGIRHVEREVWLEPLLRDLETFEETYMRPLHGTGKPIAVDIETANDTITCIGFAPNPTVSLVVPFFNSRSTTGSYWSTDNDEVTAWTWVRKILEDPKYIKLFHNGAYDISWLSHKMGFQVTGIFHDTMLMSHSLEPELPKSLGHLSSIYCDFGEWKTMVKHDSNKDEE